MPIYLFWGEDDFAMNQEIVKLREDILDPNWFQFNYHKISGDRPEDIQEALNQAMTPVFGSGGRLVWLENCSICQQCSEELLSELKRTLPNLPASSTLLLSAKKKPDGRNKATKLLQKLATLREFSPISPWKTDALVTRVEQTAKTMGVKLTRQATTLLAESVGNNTRQLWNELEKLQLWSGGSPKPIDETIVSRLVVVNTQNSLQLAAAIRTGDSARALELVADLLQRNEPPLKIVATLIGQFRTWLTIRLLVDSGEKDDRAIAKAAEVGNPKRIYFLRKEIQPLNAQQLLATLPLLLALEVSLKRGAEPFATLQTNILQLCQICRSRDRQHFKTNSP
ncbi:DNA polymerase III subunit delta [Lusitaniella coriacea]|uniref:DNA polymerase III subunit delta n=1 Tax=Lusitaniella coriacea TaxID=1983105 RepID=UPI003CEC25E6